MKTAASQPNGTWAKADRRVLASGRADLQAIQFMLTTAERTHSGARMVVRGGPQEWRRYAGSEVAEDA
jgi:hypothetical protein